MRWRTDTPSPWRGLLAGAVGGFAAAWAMEQFQARLSDATADGVDDAQRASGRPSAWDARSQDQLSGALEPATVATADAGAELVLGRRLAADEWSTAGPLMHYAFGVTVGAVYGALAETRPEVTRLGGVAFGLTVWSAADELGVPLLNLAPPPQDRPLRAHAYSFLSHVVYGMTTEVVRYTFRGSAVGAGD
jgi:putative membrane protein